MIGTDGVHDPMAYTSIRWRVHVGAVAHGYGERSMQLTVAAAENAAGEGRGG